MSFKNLKKAIVLGGTDDHIRLIEILKDKGYYTVLIDYFENPPAKNFADEHIRESTLDINKITALAKELNPDLVITACIDQSLLTMAYVCEKLKLSCHISYQIALELTNKAIMKQKFVENQIPSSGFFILENSSKNINIDLKYPLVVKPADANSSKGITKVLNSNGIDAAIEYAYSFSRSKKVIVEEFVEGEEFSVDIAITDFEPTILLLTKNIKLAINPNNFTIAQSLYPATYDDSILNKIKEIAKKLTLCFGLKNGPMLIQLLYDGENISVVEFSARIGGGSKHHFIKKMTGFDLLDWYVNLLINEIKEIEVHQMYKFGSMNYIYAKNATINEFNGFDTLKNKGIIEQFFYYKTKGMKINSHISSADRPAGYMISDNLYEQYIYKTKFAKEHIEISDENNNDMILHE
jgi:biotin carboxylase